MPPYHGGSVPATPSYSSAPALSSKPLTCVPVDDAPDMTRTKLGERDPKVAHTTRLTLGRSLSPDAVRGEPTLESIVLDQDEALIGGAGGDQPFVDLGDVPVLLCALFLQLGVARIEAMLELGELTPKLLS
jgi:hypothetical protein